MLLVAMNTRIVLLKVAIILSRRKTMAADRARGRMSVASVVNIVFMVLQGITLNTAGSSIQRSSEEESLVVEVRSVLTNQRSLSDSAAIAPLPAERRLRIGVICQKISHN